MSQVLAREKSHTWGWGSGGVGPVLPGMVGGPWGRCWAQTGRLRLRWVSALPGELAAGSVVAGMGQAGKIGGRQARGRGASGALTHSIRAPGTEGARRVQWFHPDGQGFTPQPSCSWVEGLAPHLTGRVGWREP